MQTHNEQAYKQYTDVAPTLGAPTSGRSGDGPAGILDAVAMTVHGSNTRLAGQIAQLESISDRIFGAAPQEAGNNKAPMAPPNCRLTDINDGTTGTIALLDRLQYTIDRLSSL